MQIPDDEVPNGKKNDDVPTKVESQPQDWILFQDSLSGCDTLPTLRDMLWQERRKEGEYKMVNGASTGF